MKEQLEKIMEELKIAFPECTIFAGNAEEMKKIEKEIDKKKSEKSPKS